MRKAAADFHILERRQTSDVRRKCSRSDPAHASAYRVRPVVEAAIVACSDSIKFYMLLSATVQRKYLQTRFCPECRCVVLCAVICMRA